MSRREPCPHQLHTYSVITSLTLAATGTILHHDWLALAGLLAIIAAPVASLAYMIARAGLRVHHKLALAASIILLYTYIAQQLLGK